MSKDLNRPEGTEKIVTLAEGNSFSSSPQFMKMEILAFFSYQWSVCYEKAILRASKGTQKYNNQCIIRYLKMWKDGWNRKMTQNKRENPLFCVILIGYWGIVGYWKLMQYFENQFPQEVSIAQWGVTHSFRLRIRIANLADDLHRFHSTVTAHCAQVLAGLPRSLQSEETCHSLLRLFGGIVGKHQVGEEAEK